ncbi:calcium-binding-like protein (macronuclear) [Tetrahymena thermophila SB210]|uniref:Calcium-binding-like protein n=1 Tax=Tetrahymena thermophila (strain SB210) TaxID=312017 RepID=I7LZW4_TETTS|nr:calcium-binding-like protein [Tetrahymena thermophila SB210]EAR85035.2 calcium-binding-like protein [Tetrahymena thermophila SB210]|eukprot:XP_001032698.2 calcium-binding-like protein [Tetrahymena thermophila SB210]
MLTQKLNQEQKIEVKKVSPKLTSFFGKKHKSVYEVCCCLYQSIDSYFNDLKSNKKHQKMNKYIQRCSEIFQHGDQDKIKELISYEYFNKSLVLLMKHPDVFQLEDKKTIINLLQNSLLDEQGLLRSSINTTEQYLKSNHIQNIVNDLCDKFEQMSFYVGSVIRIVSESKELLGQILSINLINKIFKHLNSNQFIIQCEAIEVINQLFLNKKNTNTKIVASQLLEEKSVEVEQTFRRSLQDNVNYSGIRMILKILYKILNDPIYHVFASHFLSIENLKIILLLAANEDQAIRKEAFLILDLFINLVQEKQDEKLKQIFKKNYQNILGVIQTFNDSNIEGEKEEQDKVDTNFLIHRLHSVSF